MNKFVKFLLALTLVPIAAVAQQSGMPSSVSGAVGDCVKIGTTKNTTGAGSHCGEVTITEYQNGTYIYETDTGSANAYVIAPSPSVSSYVAGQAFKFKVANANTGSSTVNVSGLGTKNIYKCGSTPLKSGDFPAGAIPTITYDGAAFQAQGFACTGNTGTIGITIDGGGVTPTTGAKGFIQVPYDCTITGWTLVGNASGSASITVSKGAYSAYPTVASIVASAAPSLSSAQKNTSTTLTGWTTSVTSGDIVSFNLDSVSGSVTRLTLQIQYTRN